MFKTCSFFSEIDPEDADNIEHAMNIVQNLLSAMKLNSDKARLRFPRLLQVVEKFVATRDEFTKAVLPISVGFLNFSSGL